jgi:hypothetical protein
MQELPTNCIICGAPIEPEMIQARYQSGYVARVPREVCAACASPKSRPAVLRHYNPPGIMPFVRLAGEIERGVIAQYRTLYESALKSAWNISRNDDLTDAELEFIRFHGRITRTQYHNILTLGKLSDLLDSTRRSVEAETPVFREMVKHGYNIFERGNCNV